MKHRKQWLVGEESGWDCMLEIRLQIHCNVLLILCLQSGLTVCSLFLWLMEGCCSTNRNAEGNFMAITGNWLPSFHSKAQSSESYPMAQVACLLCVHLSWLSGVVIFLFASSETTMSGSPLLLMAGADIVEEQRARWERKRSRTAKELLETEHKYLEQLDLVITVSIWASLICWYLQAAHTYFWCCGEGSQSRTLLLYSKQPALHIFTLRRLKGVFFFSSVFYFLCNIS